MQARRPSSVRKTTVVRVGNSVIASAGLATSDDDATERAFEAAVAPEIRRLYSLALSILDDAGEAEDAVQETLLKAWRVWDLLSRMDRQAAWLTRVCVNHCISRRRMLRSRGFPLPGLIDRASPSTSSGDDAQRIDMDRAYRQLSRNSAPRSPSTTATGIPWTSAPFSWDAARGPCERTWNAGSRSYERS